MEQDFELNFLNCTPLYKFTGEVAVFLKIKINMLHTQTFWFYETSNIVVNSFMEKKLQRLDQKYCVFSRCLKNAEMFVIKISVWHTSVMDTASFQFVQTKSK